MPSLALDSPAQLWGLKGSQAPLTVQEKGGRWHRVVTPLVVLCWFLRFSCVCRAVLLILWAKAREGQGQDRRDHKEVRPQGDMEEGPPEPVSQLYPVISLS